MKELNLYQCEICGTKYGNKSMCINCEKSHVKDLVIVGSRYLSIGQDNSGMPVSITVKGKDGKNYIYKR